MSHVVINNYSPDGSETLAVVTLEDGKIEVQSQNERVKKSLLNGRWNYKGVPVSARDGKKFLEALPSIFSGSYVRAQLVDER